jgi:Ni,Fe-hydrogenase III small subunit/Pyruvate/2-oxoacid:ferredoxin oxidoreductase delta subunit
MIRALRARFQQRYRTFPFPKKTPELLDRFIGKPVIDVSLCHEGCLDCIKSCPTDAIGQWLNGLEIDLGKCIFCNACAKACPKGAIVFTRDYRLAVRERNDLLIGKNLKLASALDDKMRRLFGRSFKLRQVSAGGCNACEADTNVLNTLVFDLGRFGVQFVASPRHADGLLITGPVTQNMKLALQKTYEAVPSPKIVIAVGACAISGGIYEGHPEQNNGADSILPVDLFIPGCPPHPYTILDGILRLLRKIKGDSASLD